MEVKHWSGLDVDKWICKRKGSPKTIIYVRNSFLTFYYTFKSGTIIHSFNLQTKTGETFVQQNTTLLNYQHIAVFRKNELIYYEQDYEGYKCHRYSCYLPKEGKTRILVFKFLGKIYLSLHRKKLARVRWILKNALDLFPGFGPSGENSSGTRGLLLPYLYTPRYIRLLEKPQENDLYAYRVRLDNRYRWIREKVPVQRYQDFIDSYWVQLAKIFSKLILSVLLLD